MRTQRASKTLSLFLAFCVVFTMLPTVAFAETGDVDSGVPLGVSGIITDFAPLDEDVAEQTVEMGTAEDMLKLPNQMIVTEETEITATDSDVHSTGSVARTMDIGGQTGVGLDADTSGTGWTWTASTSTLTLNSSYQGGYITLECADTDTINLLCDGAVTVNQGSTYAIDCYGSLVIKGEGQLTLSGGIRASKNIVILGTMGNISGGIDAGGSVTISGRVGDIASTIHTIYANGDITISSNAVVGKIGAGGTGSSSSTHGIYSYSGGVVINGTTGDISGTYYGIYAKGGSVIINGTTGAISSALGSTSDNSGIRAESGGVTITGETGAISSASNYGVYAKTGDVLISGKTGDITGAKAIGILALAGGITISPNAVVGNIAGAQNSIDAYGDVTIGGKTGDITGVVGSFFGGGIRAGGSVTITGETGDIASTNASIPAIGAGGDVSIIGSVGKIAVTASSGGGGLGIYADGGIHIINSATVSSFNGAFNKAPATLPSSYTATWSNNADGSGVSTGSTYTWNGSHKYVKIENGSGGGTSVPTVSSFVAGRKDADSVRFYFTPSTTGKFGFQIEKKESPAPTNLPLVHEMTAIMEFGIEAREFGATATDILVIYLQTEDTEGVKSQIYSLEVPAYTPPTDAKAPSISEQPTSATYVQNETPINLLVLANNTDGGSLSYQWYCNTTNSTVGGTPVTSSSINGCTPSTAMVGTTYYYCVVTNTNSEATTNKTATATSDVAAVTVNAPGGTTSPIEITGFEAIPDEDVGKAGSTICVNVAEVINLLKSIHPYASAMHSGNQTTLFLITGWEDTDGYNPSKAGSYTFTAAAAILPGFANSAGHKVTVEVAVASADAATITITKHPQNVTVTQGSINGTLTAEAVASNGKPIRYQWRRFIGGIGSDNTQPLLGETSSTLTIPAGLTAGTYQYLCVFNTDGTDYVDSNTAIVTVNPPSSGGSSGSGGGRYTPPPATTPPQGPPNQPITATAPVTAARGTNGIANANIPTSAIPDAITRAEATARAQGSSANGISIELNVTMPQGATSLTAAIPQSALQSLVTAGVNQFTVNGAPVSLGLNQSALQAIQSQASGGITIGMTPATGLSASAQSMIGSRPVYNITISYTDKSGKTQNITSFGSGTATLAIPYTAGRNEAAGYLFGVYVDGKGNASRIPGSVYDANSRSILIPTNHLSVYGVGYTIKK